MKLLGWTVFCATLLVICTLVNFPLMAGTGVLHYFEMTGPNWDPYTSSGLPGMRATIRGNVAGLATFTPYFDTKLSWYPRATLYVNSYAIYINSQLATDHPEWILRDAAGTKLYIPWGCAGGTCPQYAGDIANPAYRKYQIDWMTGLLAGNNASPYGYAGLWIDDVNLNMAVANGNNTITVPMDSQTGLPMTVADWNLYFARYVEAIKTALPPTATIIHNALWFLASPPSTSVRREIAAADFVHVERGFGDSGLTGGTGQWSLFALMNYIDYVHSIGTAVEIGDYYLADQMYSLACYFLVQNGWDTWGIGEQTPGNWPPKLYNVNLGAATGPRRKTLSGIWRRDFAHGLVLVNEPGAPIRIVNLPAGALDPNGAPAAKTITLGPKQGVIFILP